MEETVIRSHRIHEGRVVCLRVDEIRLTDGTMARREVVEHGPAVCVVAIDDRDRVLLVRQHRLPAGRDLVEIPAGSLNEGEDPLFGAQRELAEETGFAASRWNALGGFFAEPGYCTEYLHLFLARDLRPESRPADEDERIELVAMPFAEAVDAVARGTFPDAKTIAGLLAAHLYVTRHSR